MIFNVENADDNTLEEVPASDQNIDYDNEHRGVIGMISKDRTISTQSSIAVGDDTDSENRMEDGARWSKYQE